MVKQTVMIDIGNVKNEWKWDFPYSKTLYKIFSVNKTFYLEQKYYPELNNKSDFTDYSCHEAN